MEVLFRELGDCFWLMVSLVGIFVRGGVGVRRRGFDDDAPKKQKHGKSLDLLIGQPESLISDIVTDIHPGTPCFYNGGIREIQDKSYPEVLKNCV